MERPNVQDKMKRPTISLALIVKNEEKNLPRLLKSVSGCFDEIILVDTGSTDKTKEIAQTLGCKIFDFVWVDDFSKARNFAFSQCSMDYIMWQDADDILDNKEAFIKWRDYAMGFVDCWLATYHYAVDKELKPIISFVRERVFKRSINPVWQYEIHEGIIAKAEWSKNFATPWSVKHLRDEEDVKADRSRNINILEKRMAKGDADARLTFYYGKELYEANRANEAIPFFEKAVEMTTLEPHDRILTYQYGTYAALSCFDKLLKENRPEKVEYFNKALDFAHKGIRLEPNRAEFYVSVGDAYVRVGAIHLAVPYFAAAKSCLKNFDSPYSAAIYSFRQLYGEAPSVQLAKIYGHLGMLDKAKKEAADCYEAFKNEEAKQVLAELERVSLLVNLKNDQIQTEDIVFTTPPQNAYEFDEELYKTKPMGGSETALIQMAKLIKQKTGRRVIVFNMRKEPLVAESGVEYVPTSRLNEYFSKFKPRTHIAWRHNIKITDAPTYLWCHDLFTQGCESVHNFDKILCLSPFHKNYVMGLQGIPEEKVIVTRNGIDPKKFDFEKPKKNENKVVWMSSPDRGLDRCMLIMDKVREEFPDLELHVYYGIEHLHQYGPHMADLAVKLKAMMDARPYVKYHGNTEQSKMYKDVSDAVIWCHPNNFIETYCITAIECLVNGIFPVVRRLGALQDTLKDAELNRQAIMLDYDWNDEDSIKYHANAVCRAILNRQWENLSGYDVSRHDWSVVADEWIDFMGVRRVEEGIETA